MLHCNCGGINFQHSLQFCDEPSCTVSIQVNGRGLLRSAFWIVWIQSALLGDEREWSTIGTHFAILLPPRCRFNGAVHSATPIFAIKFNVPSPLPPSHCASFSNRRQKSYAINVITNAPLRAHFMADTIILYMLQAAKRWWQVLYCKSCTEKFGKIIDWCIWKITQMIFLSTGNELFSELKACRARTPPSFHSAWPGHSHCVV